MSVGNVYYFNATPNAMLLLNNNHILNGNLAGTQKANGYAPNTGTIGRSSADKSGNETFGEQNKLVVSFPAGTSQEYEVDINSNEIHIERDVELYIFFNQVVLVSPEGAGDSVVITGKALSEAEVEELTQAAGA
jgi:hypothetical protein